MFAGITNKYWDDTFKVARASKYTISSQLSEYIEFIYDYVKLHPGLYISNLESTIEKKYIPGISCNVWCTNAAKHAYNIANALVAKSIYVKLYTNVYRKHLSVSINNSFVLQMYSIDVGIFSSSSLSTTSKTASNDNPYLLSPIIASVPYVPILIELIGLYHKLTMPEHYSDWKELQKTINTITPHRTYKNITRNNKPPFGKVIKSWIRDNKSVVLIGENAVDLLNNTFATNVYRVVADIKSSEIYTQLARVLPSDLKIIVKRRSKSLSNLPHIELSSFFVAGKQKQQHILDVYGSGLYEVIPYTIKNNIQVGSSALIKMMLYMELYVIHTVALMTNNINTISTITNNKHYYISSTPADDPDILFEFIGIYIKNITMELQSKTKPIYPYVPAKYKHDTGTFKTL